MKMLSKITSIFQPSLIRQIPYCCVIGDSIRLTHGFSVSDMAAFIKTQRMPFQEYNLDDGGYDFHNKCAAVLKKKKSGKCVVALSISGLDFRMEKELISELKKDLDDLLDRKIGYKKERVL